MEKKSQDFSMEDIKQLAGSPTARQLMDMMRQRDPKAVSEAARQAASGDYSQALRAMAQLLTDPAVREQLQKLGDAYGRS